MQFLKISDSTKLSDLTEIVGSRNVDSILNLNMLPRVPNIGQAFEQLVEEKTSDKPDLDFQRKKTLLNTLTSEADIFEYACLQTESGWNLLDTVGTMEGMLRVPENIKIPDSIDVLGGTNTPIDKTVYQKAMNYLNNDTNVDPVIFNSYSMLKDSQILDMQQTDGGNASDNPINQFNLPWGEITLYSSLDNESVDFPVYPAGFEDGTSATYEPMPDMLYQYEPWQTYKSSGPRSVNFEFDMHRDMWTGDHRDGKCNELIRFCESNCFPRYQGSTVQTAKVTMYLAGKKLITGIITEVKVAWDDDSPIGLDGIRLHLKLTLSITEVSDTPLSYDSVRSKELIG